MTAPGLSYGTVRRGCDTSYPLTQQYHPCSTFACNYSPTFLYPLHLRMGLRLGMRLSLSLCMCISLSITIRMRIIINGRLRIRMPIRICIRVSIIY